MTPDQRIGQLFELGLAGDRLGPAEINLIQTDHIGSVWFVERSSAGVNGIRAVASAVQAQVSSATTANVRFFVAANQEGGLIQAMQGPGFSVIPSAVVQGSWAPTLLQSRAAVWGRLSRRYAPVGHRRDPQALSRARTRDR
ncbi:MAG: hypothetical protein AUG96_01695 [Chloroflexi bacterium 13_1_20CM_4_66_15]|nr:MAG: hypothetical protein AUG96_01695 [Chloroflexi bacterium 13_1_20CM_4_66_15]